MSSKYTVVQYCPDPVAEERINIGVIVWDERGANARFVRSLERARKFGDGDIGQIRDFISQIQRKFAATSDLFKGEKNPELVESMVRDWSHVIQFTPSRGSLESPSTLLSILAPKYLKDRKFAKRQGRDRRVAIADAFELLKASVAKRNAARVTELVHRFREVSGKFNSHQFDVVLANGKAIAAIDALSFEVGTPKALQQNVDAVAWALDDVKKVHPNLPLAVYALQPKTSAMKAVFNRAGQTYEGLGADFIHDKSSLSQWTDARAAAVRLG